MTSNPESPLTGINTAVIAGLAEDYLDDPAGVSEEWREYFERLGEHDLADLAGWEAVAAWKARRAIAAGQVNGQTVSSADADAAWRAAEQTRLDWAVRELSETYRRRGHLHAATNPISQVDLELQRDEFALERFGLSESDLGRQVYTGDLPLPEYAPLGDILGCLHATYCGSIGFEVMHIENTEERAWLLDRIEATAAQATMTSEVRRWVLKKLTAATHLEEFLHRKFVGAKRFSVEGLESMIPFIHVLVETAGEAGCREIVLGMAHRGRLSVLINVLRQSPADLFTIFKDEDAETQLGGGDVKYHLGKSHDVQTRSGAVVHLSLCFNPSHLEFVNPVVQGRVRAKQERIGDRDGTLVMPLLIHGDAAVMGQGIVHETLNLADLVGYGVGGTIHIVANNQVGFTAEPTDSRSTRYCTDISKLLGVPVLHVNAEDMNAVVFAAQMAAEFRQKFRRDVFIDLVGFRRHGHNEGDEPRFTQPSMYAVIDEKKGVRELYAEALRSRGELTEEQDQQMVRDFVERLESELGASGQNGHPKPSSMEGLWKGYAAGADGNVPEATTGVDKDRLIKLLGQLSKPPEGFSLNRKLKRLLNNRLEVAEGERKVDWAIAEHLAFATLVADGTRVRISGQDSQRGTFSHRHAVLRDSETGRTWVPLADVAADPALFSVFNSPLSEAAVLGFDYGYSLDMPDALTIWEAQFGDFANGAQVIIDQFITSSEDKWARLTGLVMLLPHGFEGQGPEHSSARLERFLQMAAEDNIQVCYPTTPAQIFHLLRRQIVRNFRKPLVVMSPKSLLRHPAVVSDLDDLATGEFQRIIVDVASTPKKTKRLLICTGRVYYDLEKERSERERDDVAIVRFEQLYPLSTDVIEEHFGPFKKAQWVFVQDEPSNMGAWQFVQARLRATFGPQWPIACVARSASASPATGSHASHVFEHQRLMDLAFEKLKSDKSGAVMEVRV